MCECGCGDFQGHMRFPGPRGVVYAIELKPACSNCGAPAGVLVHRFSAKLAKEWCVGDLPLAPFADDIDGYAFGIPVVEPQLLADALEDEMGHADAEVVRDAANVALAKTWAKWRAETWGGGGLAGR